MQPFVAWWRQHRAEAIAKMHAAAEHIGATVDIDDLWLGQGQQSTVAQATRP